MKRIIRIEVRFEDGRDRPEGLSREERQAVIATKVAVKATAEAILRSFGMKVTATSSSSTIKDLR
jgi:hypothetical protein